MKTWKKLAALLLALSMAFALAACSNSQGGDGTAEPTGTPPVETQGAEDTQPPETEPADATDDPAGQTAEPAGELYRVTVPCGVCGGEHRAEVPAETMLRGAGAALACPETGQLCCYIGEPGRVEAALRQLEITVEKKKEGDGGTFVDDVIMYEALSELKDIAARGGISCTCGGKGCAIEVQGAAGRRSR